MSETREPAWETRPERGSIWALRAVVRLALVLGRPVARTLLHLLSLYFLAASAADRRASRRFLRRALGREPGLADVYRNFHAFATTILDRVYLLNGQFRYFDVRVHGEDAVVEPMARGEGCLLVGSHLGSFEIVRFLGHEASVPSVALVMYAGGTRRLNAVLDAINPRLAMRIIPLGNLDTMLQVERALADGEFVGMLADRAIEGESTAECAFFGLPARFPLGPFRVAAMLKRPVVLMFGLYRGGRRYDVHFERIEDTGGAERGNRENAAREAQRRYVARLEHFAREAPDNWFNFHDVWK